MAVAKRERTMLSFHFHHPTARSIQGSKVIVVCSKVFFDSKNIKVSQYIISILIYVLQ